MIYKIYYNVKKNYVYILLNFIIGFNNISVTYSQGTAINSNGNSADITSIFDISSTDKGILIPRMNSLQRDAITTPAIGLTIYNTDCNNFNFFNGISWIPFPSGTGSVPATPGNITGVTTACNGQTGEIYSINPVLGANSYVWSIPSGASITNNTGTSITVNFGTISGNICVSATGNCASSSQSCLTVAISSSLASPVAGINEFFQTQIIWNWNSVSGATGYKWNTINDYSTATDIGNNISFNQTGLSCNTSYTLYVWAYNSCSYSSPSVLTQNTDVCFICGVSTIQDYDSNVYNTIQIGTQCWMKENMKATTFFDGGIIPNVSDDATWGSLTTKAYCDYDNNPANSNTYGRLYNWYAASDPVGVCPTGWHVPTDADWCTLENFLESGVDTDCNLTGLRGSSVGGQLKESGTSHWTINTGATNSSGFTALPGGFRILGTFSYLTNYGQWWTTTSVNSTYAVTRWLGWNILSIGRGDDPKYMGKSIRCIKN